MAHSSESFGLKLIYMRYFVPKMQQINLEIVSLFTIFKLICWILGIKYLVYINFRPKLSLLWTIQKIEKPKRWGNCDPSRASEASEAWRFEGSESCTFRLIGSHMAGSTWLKLAGLVQGNSVTDMGYVRGGMIHDSWIFTDGRSKYKRCLRQELASGLWFWV